MSANKDGVEAGKLLTPAEYQEALAKKREAARNGAKTTKAKTAKAKTDEA